MNYVSGIFDGVHKGHQALLALKPDVVYVLPPPHTSVLTSRVEKERLLGLYSDSSSQIKFVTKVPDQAREPLSATSVLYEGFPICSDRIKEAVIAGRMEEAEAMLGYPYTLSGEVVYGKQLGRTVGMPTVNLKTAPDKLLPAYGVYGTVTIVDGMRYVGVTSIGPRPTVDNLPTVTIETFLLHFNKELYGQHISLEVKTCIRPILKFDTLEEVRQKVDEDVMHVVAKNLN